MPTHSRNDLATLNAFAVICRRGSFRLAASELGVSTSALSHSLRILEERLGIKLLNRTTRAISPTAAGAALVKGLDAGFEQIETALAELSQFRNAPAGTVRLNVPKDAARLLVNPVLPRYLQRYPRAQIEMMVDDSLVDIVRGGFDAGIRHGLSVPQDMVSLPLTPPLEWVLAASPAYLRLHGVPQQPEDLQRHSCIRMRLGDQSVYHWELGRGERLQRVDVPGRLMLNETEAVLEAVLADVGIGYFLQRRIQPHLEAGELLQLLPDWSPSAEPFAIYYPSRRQLPANLTHLVQMIRQDNGLPALDDTRRD